MADRRAKGLCYNCPEKFHRDHHRTMKGVYLLELEEGEDEEGIPEISLHALTGICSGRTMQLHVRLAGKMLLVLVDSRYMHTFVAEGTTKRLGITVSPRPGMKVAVANGDRVECSGLCRDVQLAIGEEDFTVDCFAIPLDGFEVVQGVQWLRTLGPITWDFQCLSMSFWRIDHRVTWHGVGAPHDSPHIHSIASQDPLLELLREFSNIFEPPQGLPLERQQDHRINLLPGTDAIAVRPYRYPQLLKDEIKRQCDEMIAQGIIRGSNSAFSSPVLLVKKHDS